MTIRTAVPSDFDRIMEIYRSAQDFMIESGNPDQWGHFHPAPELVKSDIESQISRVVCDGDVIHGVFVMLYGPDPTYAVIEEGVWLNHDRYVVFHRMASDGTGGVFRSAVRYGKSVCASVRIDTHADNAVMQRHIEESGFVRCGIIHLENGSPRIAYQWAGSDGEEAAPAAEEMPEVQVSLFAFLKTFPFITLTDNRAKGGALWLTGNAGFLDPALKESKKHYGANWVYEPRRSGYFTKCRK